MQPPVMRASITYHIQPSGCGSGVHFSSRAPLPTRSLTDLRRVDLFELAARYFSSEGLYYAYIYSLERMLCKSELENRFLIAARKKSGDFAPTHLYPKRVARAIL